MRKEPHEPEELGVDTLQSHGERSIVRMRQRKPSSKVYHFVQSDSVPIFLLLYVQFITQPIQEFSLILRIGPEASGGTWKEPRSPSHLWKHRSQGSDQ